jgi:hypothetical protein
MKYQSCLLPTAVKAAGVARALAGTDRLRRATCRVLVVAVASLVIGATLAGAGTRYALTQGYYSELMDLDAIVVQEFGPGAVVADWETIKADFAGDIEGFCNRVGLVNYRDNAMCYRGGQGWANGNRHYFLERHDHLVPSGWLVHDQIDDDFLDLGSWYDLSMRVLAEVPAGQCMTATDPAIQITSLPTYGSYQSLCGVVRNASPAAYHVATYLFLEGLGWYTKPTYAGPCTSINSDGAWCVNVTTGYCDRYASRYAVYLLPIGDSCPIADAASVPPPQSGSAPRDIEDRNPYLDAPTEFPTGSGYFWVKKDAAYRPSGPSCLVGPGFNPGVGNYFTPDNVTTDASGMHLSINNAAGPWQCAETYLRDPLGYGEYRIETTGRVDTIDPQMVFGMFTWDNWESTYHREIDVEWSRWGNSADACNSQYVVQPCSSCVGCGLQCSSMCDRFPIQCPDDTCPLTWIMNWTPGQVAFSVYQGHYLCNLPEPPLAQWTTTAGVPIPGSETFRLNFWLFQGSAPQTGQAKTITMSDFHHAPPLGDIGSTLQVGKSTQQPGNLVLSWGAACGTGPVTDYAIYEGTLAAPRGTGQGVMPCYDHVPKTCNAGTDHTEEITPSSALDLYYLVVPQGDAGEGSYGVAENQLATSSRRVTPRPASVSACREPQSSAPCVPRGCPSLDDASRGGS